MSGICLYRGHDFWTLQCVVNMHESRAYGREDKSDFPPTWRHVCLLMLDDISTDALRALMMSERVQVSRQQPAIVTRVCLVPLRA
jgi:hypothetical protein